MEIPKGSEKKYEYDEKLGEFKLDFIFTGGFHFPFAYGLVPETLADDGDHLDAFIITDEPLKQGDVVQVKPIGVIDLLDRGQGDNKILCVPAASPDAKKYQTIEDLDFDYTKLFTEFFAELGRQKNKVIEIIGFRGQDRAVDELQACHERYKKSKI